MWANYEHQSADISFSSQFFWQLEGIKYIESFVNCRNWALGTVTTRLRTLTVLTWVRVFIKSFETFVLIHIRVTIHNLVLLFQSASEVSEENFPNSVLFKFSLWCSLWILFGRLFVFGFVTRNDTRQTLTLRLRDSTWRLLFLSWQGWSRSPMWFHVIYCNIRISGCCWSWKTNKQILN